MPADASHMHKAQGEVRAKRSFCKNVGREDRRIVQTKKEIEGERKGEICKEQILANFTFNQETEEVKPA